MPTNRNQQTPPQTSTPQSGASDNLQLQWVIQNQNSLSEKAAIVDTKVANIMLMLDRIEKKIDKQDDKVQKNTTSIKIASAIVLTAAATIWFMVDGKLGKIHDFMESSSQKITVEQNKPKTK
jgi:hypothetical protein